MLATSWTYARRSIYGLLVSPGRYLANAHRSSPYSIGSHSVLFKLHTDEQRPRVLLAFEVYNQYCALLVVSLSKLSTH